MVLTQTVQSPRSTSRSIVNIEGLTKRYGQRTVVNDLTFEMWPGTITGFVGPNGAGKTTTIRMLLGLIRHDDGHLDVCGNDISRVGALIDGPSFYPALSARRNLRILATLSSINPSRIGEVLEQVDLIERANDPVRAYSLGMRQRLGVAAALLSDPDVLFLDEPTNGLDPQGILDFRSLLRDQAEAGKSILISSHLLTEIEQICDRLVFIRNGSRVFCGPIADLEREQRAELIIRPANEQDSDRLIELCAEHGYTCRHETAHIRVATPSDNAGEINKLAFQEGITLAELHSKQEDLEATFLRMIEELEA